MKNTIIAWNEIYPLSERFTPGMKTLRLKLHNVRPTWLDIDVRIADESGENGYAAKVLAEWEGEEAVDLLLAGMRRVGKPSGFESCTHICFKELSSAFSPTEMELRGIVWLPEMPVLRINDRDWMLENFMGPRFWDSAEWHRVPGDGLDEPGGVEFTKNWIWCVMSYAIKSGRTHMLAYEKDFDVDISGFEALLISVSTDIRGKFTCRVTADGRECADFEACGIGERHDLRIPINGTRLQKIRIGVAEAEPHAAGDEGSRIAVNISWIILQKKGMDPAAHMEVRGCEPITPNDAPEPYERSLPLGFLLDHAGMAELRAKTATSDFHARHLRGIINEAESHLGYPDPEPLVGRFSFVPYTNYGLDLMQDPAVHAHQVLVYSAFAYQLTREAKYAHTARRWLLAVCRCDNWSVGFITRFPVGLEGYRHPLADGPMAQAAAICYDMIFNFLTESDRREVEDAMMRCAVPVLDSFLQRVQGDRGFMQSNMYICYSMCTIYAIRTAARTRPEALELLPRGIERLKGALGLIFGQDGSTHEGTAYWDFTSTMASEGLLLLSRELGLPPAEIAPPGFARTLDYMLHMHTTCPTDTAGGKLFFGIADGGGFATVSGISILFICKAFGRRDAMWLYRQIKPENGPPDDELLASPGTTPQHYINARNWMLINSGILDMKFYDSDPAQPPELPPYKRFEACGRVFMRTGDGVGDTLLFFEGGPKTFFHTHKDKGQILLDAAGEHFLTDAGMISYDDPSSLYYDKTSYHNVMTLDGCDQAYADAVTAVRVLAEETSDSYDFLRADLTASYRGLIRYVRSILFVRPGYIVVLDEADGVDGGVFESFRWNFHSALPFVADVDGAVLDSGRASMSMLWPSGIIKDVSTGVYTDSKGTVSCHNLFLRADPAIRKVFMPFLLVPRRAGEEISASRLQPCVFAISGPSGTDTVTCAPGSIIVERTGKPRIVINWSDTP